MGPESRSESREPQRKPLWLSVVAYLLPATISRTLPENGEQLYLNKEDIFFGRNYQATSEEAWWMLTGTSIAELTLK
jgi:hypothetical protein